MIADLHACYYEDMKKITETLETEDYDCVLLLGDIEAGDMKKIAAAANGKPCLYVLGNHDHWGQNEGIIGLTDLDGKTVEINGVRISGVSGAPRYKEGSWGMRTEEEVENALSGVGETDILISHESPYHLLSKNRAHGGFVAVSDFIKKAEPAVHIFGHHHMDWEETIGPTREVCVYGCSVITTRPFSARKIL